MPCSGTRCYPAIDWALQGSQKQEALSTKLCNWIDLIALIRAQTNLDIASGLAVPSATTNALVTELITQFNGETSLYTADEGAVSLAGIADSFGLVCEVNCRLVNVLVRTCRFQWDNAGTDVDAQLDTYDNIVFSNTEQLNAHTQFLCCIADHLRQLQSFLERTVAAKKCEVPC